MPHYVDFVTRETNPNFTSKEAPDPPSITNNELSRLLPIPLPHGTNPTHLNKRASFRSEIPPLPRPVGSSCMSNPNLANKQSLDPTTATRNVRHASLKRSCQCHYYIKILKFVNFFFLLFSSFSPFILFSTTKSLWVVPGGAVKIYFNIFLDGQVLA